MPQGSLKVSESCALLGVALVFKIEDSAYIFRGLAPETRTFSLSFFHLPSEVTLLFLVKKRLKAPKQVERLRNANINNSKSFS